MEQTIVTAQLTQEIHLLRKQNKALAAQLEMQRKVFREVKLALGQAGDVATASLIPAEQAAKFFGFYNMLGKFAAVLGPLLVGWFGVLTGSSRLGLLAVLILFIIGGILLWRVPLPKRI